MEPGNIVEYIDRQKFICAAVLEIKGQRLRLLNENNREVKLSLTRLSHISGGKLPLSLHRDKMVEALRERDQRRRRLADEIDILELWEVLNSEREWIDLDTMTGFCFSDALDGDHQAAVIRAFFQNRLYFKFDHDRFFPHTPDEVAHLQQQAEAEARRERLIQQGGLWLQRLLTEEAGRPGADLTDAEVQELIAIIKSYYLHESESAHQEIARAIMKRAGTSGIDALFTALVRVGVWDADENVDIHRLQVSRTFPGDVEAFTRQVIHTPYNAFGNGRRDLTHLQTITIDGQATLDFDDALTLEPDGDGFRVGVHISDVGQVVGLECPIDREAINRASTIYMPDGRIPMLPPLLAEEHCSLKAGEVRPAISTMIRLTRTGEIVGSEIFPSVIQVSDQLTYYDVNLSAEENRAIADLCHIARAFRQKRFSEGAVHISLPEVNVWFDEEGELNVSKTNRESPSRMMVSEIMIMANWLTARFLADQGLPAIYRSQMPPKERLYKEDEGTLFQNWMQRRHLNRFILSPQPEPHAGLGLDAYTTATSPIRKYSDLISQRQIRAVFGLNPAYSGDDITRMIQLLESPMRAVITVQNRRKRYWLLKYLEKRVGAREEAIVLSKRRNNYAVLLTDYMIECLAPVSGHANLKPEDLVRVTIQHVNPRKDVLSVFIG